MRLLRAIYPILDKIQFWASMVSALRLSNKVAILKNIHHHHFFPTPSLHNFAYKTRDNSNVNCMRHKHIRIQKMPHNARPTPKERENCTKNFNEGTGIEHLEWISEWIHFTQRGHSLQISFGFFGSIFFL